MECQYHCLACSEEFADEEEVSLDQIYCPKCKSRSIDRVIWSDYDEVYYTGEDYDWGKE